MSYKPTYAKATGQPCSLFVVPCSGRAGPSVASGYHEHEHTSSLSKYETKRGCTCNKS